MAESNSRIFLISILFPLFLFYACGGNGLSVDKKNEIENFEKEWQVVGISADNFHSKLVLADSTYSSPHTFIKTDSMLTVSLPSDFKSNIDNCAALKALFEGFKAGWDKDGKDWGIFKNKAMKGELVEEEVDKELNLFRKKNGRGGKKYQKLAIPIRCHGYHSCLL